MTIDEIAGQEYSRRDFLGLMGKALAGAAVYPLASGFLDNADAGSYRMPSDSELKQWMNQPVEQTLRSLKGGYTPVNDSNYQREVFGSTKPVMVLFYGVPDQGSQGNAALVKAINENFPQIKTCGYKINNKGSMTKAEFNVLASKYGLKDAPAILFYKHEDGKTEYMDQVFKGIEKIDTLKKAIDNYNDAIPRFFLK
jgi:hypothetical protein